MEFLLSVLRWLADPAHWQGPDGVGNRLVEHVQISLVSILVAALVALPLGLLVGHTGRGGVLAVSLANIGRAVPSYAVMVIVFPLWLQSQIGLGGIAFVPTFVAMTLLAIPPLLLNTYVGVRGVDRDLVEAARAMGMRGGEILSRVEVPLALPAIFAGLRTATVQVIATASLGADIALGGLGRYIIDGIARREFDRIWAGVVLIAALAIAAELALALLQRRAVSAGLRTRVDDGGPLSRPGTAPQPGGV